MTGQAVDALELANKVHLAQHGLDQGVGAGEKVPEIVKLDGAKIGHVDKAGCAFAVGADLNLPAAFLLQMSVFQVRRLDISPQHA